MNVLDEIVRKVRARTKELAEARPISSMNIPKYKRRSLVSAIEKAWKVALIGEIKRASPSAGVIRSGVDVVDVGLAIERGGGTAISVLTEPEYFMGDLSSIKLLKNVVRVPILRKDFIVEEYQLYESAEAQADAVLLIVKILGKRLPRFLELTHELGMEGLVEVTTEEELDLALSAGAELIGINNRDLSTFEVNVERTLELAPLVPEEVVLVSESGIRSREDVERVVNAGVDAVLVGTSLMRAKNIEKKVRSLLG